MADAKRDSPAKDWCFTCNDPRLIAPAFSLHMAYLVYQEEVAPQTGHHHLQGFVQFHEKKRFSWVQEQLPEGTHIEKRRGTQREAAEYCKKEQSRFPDGLHGEYGHLQIQGKRNDLSRLVERVFEDHASFIDLTLDEETQNAAAKHMKFIDRIIAFRDEKNSKADMKKSLTEYKLKTWQAELEERVKEVPDPRVILWYFDTTGGAGKSWMARFLLMNYNACVLPAGRFCDLAYLWRARPEGCQIAVFDLSRTLQKSESDRIDPLADTYTFLEKLKDGIINSTKYEPMTLYFPTPHCIVFANFPPDQGKMSLDRWSLHNVTPEASEPMYFSLP